MFNRLSIMVGAALLALVASACSAATPAAQGLNVVTAFYPYQFVAQRIVGDLGTVTSLTQPGAEPHDLELTPRQIASLTEADLVVYQHGFQAAVDSAVAQTGPKRVLDVAAVVPLLPGAEDEHQAEEGHVEEHGATDPHLWLDPTLLAKAAEAVGAQLQAARPEHAATLKANQDALIADLTALDQRFSAGLKSCSTRVFVTSHAAFAYLAARYDLQQEGIAGLDPSIEPTPARIEAVHQVVAEHHVTTIFFETLASDAVAKALAQDLKLTTDVLDPAEGLTDQSRGKDYLQVMDANLTALQKANGCP